MDHRDRTAEVRRQRQMSIRDGAWPGLTTHKEAHQDLHSGPVPERRRVQGNDLADKAAKAALQTAVALQWHGQREAEREVLRLAVRAHALEQAIARERWKRLQRPAAERRAATEKRSGWLPAKVFHKGRFAQTYEIIMK